MQGVPWPETKIPSADHMSTAVAKKKKIVQARILERVVTPFSRGSFRPKEQTQVSFLAGRFFTIWATREDPSYRDICIN